MGRAAGSALDGSITLKRFSESTKTESTAGSFGQVKSRRDGERKFAISVVLDGRHHAMAQLCALGHR